MLTIQHYMLGLLSSPESSHTYKSALLYPDAVRAYSGRRELSHFERSSDGADTSYWRFPADMKAGKEEILKSLASHSHLSGAIRPAAVGEETDIRSFEAHNKGFLPPDMYQGIHDHLVQDMEFDAFIRKAVDCSGKYEDRFVLPDGTVCNGASARRAISDIEQHGIYLLAERLFKEQGVKVGQGWLDGDVLPVLQDAYGTELAEKTFSYMKIDPAYERRIREQDWSFRDGGPAPADVYEGMYDAILGKMGLHQDLSLSETDLSFLEKSLTI